MGLGGQDGRECGPVGRTQSLIAEGFVGVQAESLQDGPRISHFASLSLGFSCLCEFLVCVLQFDFLLLICCMSLE